MNVDDLIDAFEQYRTGVVKPKISNPPNLQKAKYIPPNKRVLTKEPQEFQKLQEALKIKEAQRIEKKERKSIAQTEKKKRIAKHFKRSQEKILTILKISGEESPMEPHQTEQFDDPLGIYEITNEDRRHLIEVSEEYDPPGSLRKRCKCGMNLSLWYNYAYGKCVDCFWKTIEEAREEGMGVKCIVKCIDFENVDNESFKKASKIIDNQNKIKFSYTFDNGKKINLISIRNEKYEYRIIPNDTDIDPPCSNSNVLVAITDFIGPGNIPYEGYVIANTQGSYMCANSFKNCCISLKHDFQPATFEEAMFLPGKTFVKLSPTGAKTSMFCKACKNFISAAQSSDGID